MSVENQQQATDCYLDSFFFRVSSPYSPHMFLYIIPASLLWGSIHAFPASILNPAAMYWIVSGPSFPMIWFKLNILGHFCFDRDMLCLLQKNNKKTKNSGKKILFFKWH